MLTKGAIGNLVNRYRAVLKKCNLINTFGSLAVASMLVLGGAGVASAVPYEGPTANLTKSGGNFKIGDTTLPATGFEIHVTETLNVGHQGAYTDVIMKSDNIINFNIGTDFWGNSVISTPTLNIISTATIGGNTIFDNVQKVVLKANSNPRIENWTSKTLEIGTLVVEPNSAKEAMLVNKMPENSDSIGFKIGKVDVQEGARLAAYGDTNTQSTHVVVPRAFEFTTVNLAKDSELKLGWRSSDYTESKDSTIGTLNLNGENAKLTTNAASAPSDPSNADTLGTGKAIIKNINFKANGTAVDATLTGDSTNVTVADGVTGASINKIETDQATINIESPEEGALAIAEVDERSNVDITTGTEHNTGNAQSDLQKLADAVAIEENNGKVTASIGENDLFGAVSATINENGELDTRTIKQARNTLMDAALQQASITTVSLDRILTNDVRKRLGDIRADKNQTGVWMRWDGGKLQGEGLSNDFNTIQIGGDTKVGKNCRLGVAGSFTHGDAEFARGTAELEGFSFAGYATWMGENGMFADIVARIGHFSNEMKVEGREGDMNNRVASLSGEYGWRFNVCDQFFVEPQVELAYTYVSSDDLQLGTAHYEFDSVDSLTGRAGLVAGWNLPNDMGNLYARASVVQQFMGDAKISGSNGSAHNIQELDGEDTWLEYGIGANIKLTDKTYIWADVERTEGADIDEEWRGTVGIRVSF